MTLYRARWQIAALEVVAAAGLGAYQASHWSATSAFGLAVAGTAGLAAIERVRRNWSSWLSPERFRIFPHEPRDWDEVVATSEVRSTLWVCTARHEILRIKPLDFGASEEVVALLARCAGSCRKIPIPSSTAMIEWCVEGAALGALLFMGLWSRFVSPIDSALLCTVLIAIAELHERIARLWTTRRVAHAWDYARDQAAHDGSGRESR